MNSSEHDRFYAAAFARNRGLIADHHQERLRQARVAIAGLGGVGGIYATTLARLGVGNFTIADEDRFEAANINRQAGAHVSTLGKEKSTVMGTLIADINAYAQVRRFGYLTPENIGDFLDGASVVFDGIDFFTMAPRRLLYREARARGIPVINVAPVGFGGAMLNFSPTGMSFDEYFAITDDMSEKEQIVQFAIGTGPRMLQRSYFLPKAIDFHGQRAPSSILGTLACANMGVSEAYKILTGEAYEAAPVSWHFDPYVRKLRRCNLWWGNRHPLQRFKKWYFMRKLASLSHLRPTVEE